MPWRWSFCSPSMKKNVLSLKIGPPTEPPNWFRLNFSRELASALLASRLVLRTNSKNEPCNWLLPDLVVTRTVGPARVPNSAEYVYVRTLNSWMSSIDEKTPMPPPVSSLLSTPSRSQSVALGREPPTESEKEPRAATSLSLPEVKKLLVFVSAVAPEVSVANCTKSRPLSGSWDTCCAVMTWPNEALLVSTATASELTSTDSSTEAGTSEKLISRASSI